MNAEQLSGAPGAPGPGVRLTRRGRVVVLLVALTAMLVAGFLLGARSVASEHAGTASTEVLVVTPGQTLWEIASGIAGPGETREVMYEIEELNALESLSLDVGQRLVVPAGADVAAG